jgi:uncharacterized membrane protein
MRRFVSHLRARPRLMLSMATGLALGLLTPGTLGVVTRALLGWNVAVWLYLLLSVEMMLRADKGHLRRFAVAQAEGAATVLAMVIVASLVSLLAVVAELSAAKLPGARHALPHVAFALTTVVGSWLLLPMVFALTYASAFYRTPSGHGLQFPGADRTFEPNYVDFLYFSFTIAVAAQTSDVAVVSPDLRRLVLLQSVLSFAFNTAILAFMINIAASLF